MKKILIAAALAAGAMSAPVFAQVTTTVTPGVENYTGNFTFDFDGKNPVTDCGNCIKSDSLDGQYAKPFGSVGNFLTVGPSSQSPVTVQLGTVGAYYLTMLWGSVDQYNLVEFLDTAGNVLGSVTGAQVGPANGNQDIPVNNPIVRFNFSGDVAKNVSAMRLSSTSNAFEIDSIYVSAVPEPATWAMMITGFGLIGGAMRRRRSTIASAFA